MGEMMMKPESLQDMEYVAKWTQKSLRNACALLFCFQIAMIILFASTSTYVMPTAGTPTQAYNFFIGIEIMMFIGFGYLMTFMKSYGLGAVGFTMLITAIGLQYYMFAESFFHQIWWDNSTREWHGVELSLYSMMNALFGVSAVLISYGALIGKIKPFQLVVLTLLELSFHAFNYECLLIGAFQVADAGGTYADHMFGAYFGLAVAWSVRKHKHHLEPATGYVADVFSFIGTLFLWIYWPSFVAGGLQADSAAQNRGLMATILALSASTITTFFLSSVMSKDIKFRPVDIQNATLAGGVAIGCSANFNVNPVNAIFIGAAAGIWSTFGFNVIQPYLNEKFGLHDTCGVHNLHAMPSVIGAIASSILAAYQQSDGRNNDRDAFAVSHGQAWRQFVAMLSTIVFAVIAGYFTGLFLQWLEPYGPDDFNDEPYWETAPDYAFADSEIVARKEMAESQEIELSPHTMNLSSKKDELSELIPSNHNRSNHGNSVQIRLNTSVHSKQNAGGSLNSSSHKKDMALNSSAHKKDMVLNSSAHKKAAELQV